MKTLAQLLRKKRGGKVEQRDGLKNRILTKYEVKFMSGNVARLRCR